MAAIDHDVGRQVRRFQGCFSLGHGDRVVVGHVAAAPNKVAPGVTPGLRDRHLAGAVDAQKGVRFGR